MKPQFLPGLRFLFILLLLASGSARAASFDCAKAASHSDKLICADATLSALDNQMAAAYQQALTLGDPPAGEIVKAQKDWLKYRGCTRAGIADSDAISCLADQYRRRIEFLAHPKICRIDRVKDCDNTNSLMLNGGAPALREFLRDRKKAEEAGEMLGGPPETIRTLSNGWLFAAACRAHDCPSKGAMILTGAGEIRAVAVAAFDDWSRMILAKDYVAPGFGAPHVSDTKVELVN